MSDHQNNGPPGPQGPPGSPLHFIKALGHMAQAWATMHFAEEEEDELEEEEQSRRPTRRRLKPAKRG